ncbi:MAG: hypothetical protein ONB16_05865 [candidate division KSB1 bacterium]|nr:hypothetical protein [candidate division KSB1 bacterium]MDZ7341401.1 hypothetical protein [candidate division KSB1 bacterium]
MSEPKMLSIWFFVGLMLTFLGAIIAGTGVYYIFRPPQNVVLVELNASLWWGAIMIIAGLVFLLSALNKHAQGK